MGGLVRSYRVSPEDADELAAGNLISPAYNQAVDGFKTRFANAMVAFDRSVNLEMFKIVDRIGMSHASGRHFPTDIWQNGNPS